MTRLAVAATLGIAFALAAVSIARAQGPNVQIVQLECTGDPELVVIENLGDAPQALAGWQLQSDPPDSEVFDLTVLGGLQPGASVFIRSGPAASGVFNWGLEFVFRDDDPTDYVRLVDDTGAVVHQVNCAGATPEPSPTPSPEPSPVADVPNGGGPPPVSGGDMAPLMMVLLGASVAAAGLGAIALPRLRLRSSPVAASGSSRNRSVAGRSARRSRGAHGRKSGYSTVSLAAVAFTAVMVFRFLRRPPA